MAVLQESWHWVNMLIFVKEKVVLLGKIFTGEAKYPLNWLRSNRPKKQKVNCDNSQHAAIPAYFGYHGHSNILEK